MKNLKFISIFLSGVLLGVILVTIFNYKSKEPVETAKVPDSMKWIKLDNYSYGEVYKLTVDNIQYIVVSKNSSDGVGIAIVKHE